MSDTRWQRLGDLFHRALEEPADRRAAFLDDACGDDAELRDELAEMLRAHDGDGALAVEGRFLAADEGGGDLAGLAVGPYRLVRLLGRGGMGDVHLAERADEQYRQQVAIKLLREDFRAPDLKVRFLQERQILARLRHPHIATLLDGGVSDDGRPYLVMEYVDGEPITDHCRRLDLPLRARLELLRTVCRAVQAAHTNLIVHRDLKPANILVTADGEVKLVDFGIAKLLDAADGEPTLAVGRMLTPAHAAPEQVAGGTVTTATDVYALGVLLYELLTDARPIDVPTGSARAMERAIVETPPVPPSRRAPQRARALRGDLDHIALKALRKEPERRYATARELEDDLGRHLDGEPVRARPDTLAYRARKFAGRHRWGVAAVAAFVVLLAAAGALQLEKSRQLTAERDRARSEQARAERMVAVLGDLLRGADPYDSPDGRTLTADEFVARIDEAVDTLDDQPAVQARLRELLAAVHSAHSRYDAARRHLERALAHQRAAGEARAVLRLEYELALLTLATEGAEVAAPLLRASLADHRALLGADHPDVRVVLQELAGALVATAPDEARARLDELAASAPGDSLPDPLGAAGLANRLGRASLGDGDPRRAEASFQQALDLMGRVLGPEHPDVLTVTHNLAAARVAAGDFAAAEPVYRRVLVTHQRVLGPETRAVGRTWDSLGGCLAHLGRLEEARAAYVEARRVLAAILGPDHPQLASTVRNLATVLSLQGRAAAAVAIFDTALALAEQPGGSWARGRAHMRGARALALHAAGRRDEALAEARAAVLLADSLAVDVSDPYRADARVVLATLLLARGEWRAADGPARTALELRRAREPAGHPARDREACLLGAALVAAGRRAEARALLAPHLDAALAWGLVHPLQRELILASGRALDLPDD